MKKRFFYIAGGVLLAVAALVLVQQANPEPALLSPVATPTPTPSPTPAQPKITWSQASLEVALLPGGGASKELTFTSSLAVQNIVVEAVPEIADFIAIQPGSFASVPAEQPQAIRLSFSIPAGTTLETYDGTIHVKSGNQTLPDTLKLSVTIAADFAVYTNSRFSFQILYPIQTEILQVNDTIAFFDLNYPELPPTFEIEIFTPTAIDSSKSLETIYVDIAHQRLGDWFDAVAGYTSNGVVVDATTINRRHFFSYDPLTGRAAELRARGADFFSTTMFTTISESLRFF